MASSGLRLRFPHDARIVPSRKDSRFQSGVYWFRLKV